MAKTVNTKAEMRHALEAEEKTITAKGELAQEIRMISKPMRGAKQGSELLTTVGLLVAPFAAGASLAFIAATGLVMGNATISAAKLAILVGGTATVTGIVKGIKRVNLSPNAVIMEF